MNLKLLLVIVVVLVVGVGCFLLNSREKEQPVVAKAPETILAEETQRQEETTTPQTTEAAEPTTEKEDTDVLLGAWKGKAGMLVFGDEGVYGYQEAGREEILEGRYEYVDNDPKDGKVMITMDGIKSEYKFQIHKDQLKINHKTYKRYIETRE